LNISWHNRISFCKIHNVYKNSGNKDYYNLNIHPLYIYFHRSSKINRYVDYLNLFIITIAKLNLLNLLNTFFINVVISYYNPPRLPSRSNSPHRFSHTLNLESLSFVVIPHQTPHAVTHLYILFNNIFIIKMCQGSTWPPTEVLSS